MTGTTQSERHHGKEEPFCGNGNLLSTFNTPLYYCCTPKRERPSCCSTPAGCGIGNGGRCQRRVSLCTCTNHLSSPDVLPALQTIIFFWCWTGVTQSTPNRCMTSASERPFQKIFKACNHLPIMTSLAPVPFFKS